MLFNEVNLTIPVLHKEKIIPECNTPNIRNPGIFHRYIKNKLVCM